MVSASEAISTRRALGGEIAASLRSSR